MNCKNLQQRYYKEGRIKPLLKNSLKQRVRRRKENVSFQEGIETLSFVTINSEIFLVKWCLWMVNVFLLYRTIILPDLKQTNVWLNVLWQISFWRESLLLLWSSLSGFQQVCTWMDQECPPLKKTPNRICHTMISSPGFDAKESGTGNDSITNRYTENLFNTAAWILDSIIKCTIKNNRRIFLTYSLSVQTFF